MVRRTGEHLRLTAVDATSARLTALVARQEKAVRDAVPAARVLVLPHAHHFVFLTHEADVLREVGAFVTSLN